MRNVIETLDALRRKFANSHRVKEHPLPAELDLCGGRYKPEVILRLLLDDETYYPGYKEVLAATFGGWLAAPRLKELRQALAIQAALEHMNGGEIEVEAYTKFTVEKDIAARYIFVGTEFLIEVYDYLGGYEAFISAPSFLEIWDAFHKVKKTINTAARAITYLHHAVDRFGAPGFQFVPSLNKAVTVFDSLKEREGEDLYKEKYVSRSLLHQRWSQNKQTLALIYSASTIQVNRKTLLRLILEGAFSYRDHQKYLHAWVGRARYVATHLFARMSDADLERKTLRVLGNGDTIPFAPPKLSDSEKLSFEEIFRQFIR
jgi:hypothetical protein